MVDEFTYHLGEQERALWDIAEHLKLRLNSGGNLKDVLRTADGEYDLSHLLRVFLNSQNYDKFAIEYIKLIQEKNNG